MSTTIEWTNETWNPVTGCTKISPGCAHCYAERFAKRHRGRFGYPADDPFRVTLHEDRLDAPLHWRKPRKVFVCSMGDLFHKDVPLDFVDRVFARMALATRHTFQVLTKRPERMAEYIAEYATKYDNLEEEIQRACGWSGDGPHPTEPGQWPLPNVWLGVTAENQAAADERIPHLLRCPAVVRFVSYEPALGPVDWRPYLSGTPRLDWLIAGGESGPGARPSNPDWFRDARDQCTVAGVPYFFKGWGAWREPIGEESWQPCRTQDWSQVWRMVCVGKSRSGRLLDGREHNEFPEARP